MKRIICILLATALAAGMSLGASALLSDGRLRGDVDADGRVTVKDATRIQMAIAALVVLSDAEQELADYNLDSKVNILDATKIQKVIAGIENPPEEPTETETAAQTETVTETQTATETVTEPEPTEPTAPNVKVRSTVKILFTNNKNWSSVYFYLYNSETGEEAAQWPGKEIKTFKANSMGEKIYYTNVDTDKYNRVVFNNGSGAKSANVALSKASSGFFISDSSVKRGMSVGTYAENGADSGRMYRTTLKYPSGYNKKIWIWTPADYKATGDKFKTIYLTDGQNLFDDDHTDSYGGWEVTDAVESMMSNGGRGVIIVGIDNGNSLRDSELTPDIGDVVPDQKADFSVRTGEQFSDFVVNTVMPYVQKHYNSGKSARDNMIAGSSSGGLEAFYIGMEHPDRFGHISSLSPAYLLFDENVWNDYLKKFDFTSPDMPRLYIYNGKKSLETQLLPSVLWMYDKLTGGGWDSSKIKLVIEDDGDHNESWWRLIFPDSVCWLYEI